MSDDARLFEYLRWRESKGCVVRGISDFWLRCNSHVTTCSVSPSGSRIRIMPLLLYARSSRSAGGGGREGMWRKEVEVDSGGLEFPLF